MIQPACYTRYSSHWRIVLMLITGLCAWAAIGIQFYITITNYPADRTALGVIVQFFSYFTILNNLAAALAMTALLLAPQSALGQFFHPGRLTAVTVYIVMVGLVYGIMLRSVWTPTGIEQVTNELLHSVNPFLFLIFWIVFVYKGRLLWRSAFTWLVFPLIYVIYITVRGAITGMYPYPFIDASSIGYGRALVNAGVLMLAFFGFNALFISVGRMIGAKQGEIVEV